MIVTVLCVGTVKFSTTTTILHTASMEADIESTLPPSSDQSLNDNLLWFYSINLNVK